MSLVALTVGLLLVRQEPVPALAPLPTAPKAPAPVAPAPPAEPTIQAQARMLTRNRKRAGTGLSVYVPRTENGERYYYSEAVSHGETMIESWADAKGRPLRAIYRLRKPYLRMTLRLTIAKGKILFDEEVWRPLKGTKRALVPIALPKEAAIHISQFHPHDVALDAEGSAQILIIDPISKTIKKAKVTREQTGKVERYRIELIDGWTLITVLPSGRFVESLDSSGLIMRETEPTALQVFTFQRVMRDIRRQ